jgi:hypothetical protein
MNIQSSPSEKNEGENHSPIHRVREYEVKKWQEVFIGSLLGKEPAAEASFYGVQYFIFFGLLPSTSFVR